MTKILICGSRGCTEDVDQIGLWSEVANHFMNDDGLLTVEGIISGGARGADKYAENFAKDVSLPIEVFKPDWKLHGKRAGYLRNITMLEQEGVDLVIALWDGESKGTKHTIDCALSRGIDLRVIFYKDWVTDD